MSRESIRAKIEQGRALRLAQHAPPPAPPVEDGECWAPDEDEMLQEEILAHWAAEASSDLSSHGLVMAESAARREARRTASDRDAASGVMYAAGISLLAALAVGTLWWVAYVIATTRGAM